MNDLFEQIKMQALELWGRLSKQQKIVLIGSVVAIFSALIYFVIQAGKPDYVPLYTNLPAEDAGVIRSKLIEQKIDFQLSPDGKTVFVPSKDQAALRIDLASQGLPKGSGWGFETFNETRLGETDKERDIRYYVALETELARTLKTMPGVEEARVKIVPAVDSLFQDKEKHASASVMLVMKPYSKLEPHQIKGIIYLVSKSVRDLAPDKVAVLDNSGNLISEGVIESNDPQSQLNKNQVTQLEIRMALERHLETKAQSMLEKAFGLGKVVVRASVDLDYAQIEEKTEQFGDGKKRSERETIESGKGNQPGANPGTDTNIPGYQGVTGGTSEYQKSDVIINYEVGKVQRSTVIPPGSVKSLSVSAMIDRENLDEQTVLRLQQTIGNALGIPNNRINEAVSVVGMAFDRTVADQFNAEIEAQKAMQRYLLIGLGVLVLLIIGSIAWWQYRKRALARQAELEAQAALAAQDAAEEARLASMRVPELPEEELTPEEMERIAVRERITELAKQDPDAAARLLKTWLDEEV